MFARWEQRLIAGIVAVCPLTELEIMFSARSTVHRQELRSVLDSLYHWVLIPDRVYTRAAGVQETLTDRGKHRSAGPIDLLVAATAEEHRLALLHYDADFKQVAEVTGQPIAWVAEPGSVN
ncbi:PIN domain nuclease [Actinoplanes oblitus]|uniref:PIN domain nuclease n=1 Tax=Actinoplanes oblitus TaxID=3040509 RepID=A0ABY8WIR2_9ACTN|nr:PIN domain nuclease [Actinoplanes oblitus]WIM97759.1 PIN domain nuclease [Actinoplanes oblitus]